MKKMKVDIKKKWLAALRSGKYKKGVGRLRTEDKFCCLGVLADVCRKRWYHTTTLNYYLKGRYDKTSCILTTHLPDSLTNKIKLDDEAEARLIKMNDTFDRDFQKIANWIEKKQ